MPQSFSADSGPLEAIASGATSGFGETFEQLDALLAI